MIKKITQVKKASVFLTLLVLVLGLQSCVDSIPVPDDNVDAKLVFESDISSSKGFRAFISTSSTFHEQQEFLHPEDIDVRITWNTDDIIILAYNKDCSCYEAPFESPVQGRKYDLQAFVPDEFVYDDIQAHMTFPRKGVLYEAEGQRLQENHSIAEANISFGLQTSGSHQYYHILPYRKHTVKSVDNQGNIQLTYTGEKEYLDLVDFNNPDIYMENLYHMDGFMLDLQGQSGNGLKAQATLEGTSIVDWENESFEKIFFEVRTVTESYYRYHLYQSRKLESLEYSNVEPPISYSNVIGGIGFFGGYSVSSDSITIQ